MSGCFSMIRIRTDDGVLVNNYVLKEYNKTPTSLVEENLIKFGEDRYLTSILLNTYTEYQIKYIPGINCYTDVPTTLKNLVLQRQRWTNSLLACHIYLLKSKFISLRLYFLIFIELGIILILPLLIIVGVTNFIIAIVIQGYSLPPVIITANIVLINLYVVILSGDFQMILYYLQYMIISLLYTVVIPYVCVLRFHVVQWNSKADLQKENEQPIEDHYMIDVSNDRDP